MMNNFMDFTDDEEAKHVDALESDSRPASKVKVTDVVREFEIRASEKLVEDEEFLDLLQMPQEESSVDEEISSVKKDAGDQIMNNQSDEVIEMDELQDALKDNSKEPLPASLGEDHGKHIIFT